MTQLLLKRLLSTSLFLGVCFFVSFVFATPQYGGALVLSTTGDPKSFNPILAKETSTTVITNHIFEGLTTTNAFTLQVEPNLAQSWEVSEDGLTWVFHLIKDQLWSDGYPFTADDVVFTFNELIFNDEIPSSARDIFTIEGKPFKVSKVDTYTVKFELPVKFAPFLRGLSQKILPKHRLKPILDSGKFNFAWGINTDPKDIVGMGAFVLDKYEPSQRIVLKRNPHYWKVAELVDALLPLPFLDKVIYLIVQNGDVDLLKFLEGTTDAYGLRGMDYPLLKPEEDKRNFTVFDLGPAMGSNFITFNQNPGTNPNTNETFVDPNKLAWFKDYRFKQAVAHAIDKNQIIQIVKNGLGYPQHSPIGPGAGFFHNDQVKKYEYDLKKAKQVLDEAGYIDRNGDGIIEDANGNSIDFNLYTNAGATERIDIASIIRQDLENLGMKVNFQALEFNTLVGKLTSTHDWDAVVIGFTGGVEPHFGKNVWSSNGQLHLWNPRQETPATNWEARIDEIFNLAVQELDEDKRKVLYDEYQQIVSENLPVVYTVLSAKLTAVRKRFGNLKPSNMGGVFHNIEEIFIKND